MCKPSCDGVPVVMHDATLKRTADVVGTLSKMAWADITRHRIGGVHVIPSLRQVLACMQSRGVGVYVEIKSQQKGLVARVMEDVSATGCSVVVSSFHADVLQAVQKLTHPPRTMALFTRPPRETLARVKALGVNEVGLRYSSVTPAWIERFTAASLPVYAYTVNERLHWERAARMGLTGVFTDNPPPLASPLIDA